jgi:hypothetical protein
MLLCAMVGLYAMSAAHFSLVFYNVYQGLVRTSVSVMGPNLVTILVTDDRDL